MLSVTISAIPQGRRGTWLPSHSSFTFPYNHNFNYTQLFAALWIFHALEHLYICTQASSPSLECLFLLACPLLLGSVVTLWHLRNNHKNNCRKNRSLLSSYSSWNLCLIFHLSNCSLPFSCIYSLYSTERSSKGGCDLFFIAFLVLSTVRVSNPFFSYYYYVDEGINDCSTLQVFPF